MRPVHGIIIPAAVGGPDLGGSQDVNGAIEHVPVARVTNLVQVAKELQNAAFGRLAPICKELTTGAG